MPTHCRWATNVAWHVLLAPHPVHRLLLIESDGAHVAKESQNLAFGTAAKPCPLRFVSCESVVHAVQQKVYQVVRNRQVEEDLLQGVVLARTQPARPTFNAEPFTPSRPPILLNVLRRLFFPNDRAVGARVLECDGDVMLLFFSFEEVSVDGAEKMCVRSSANCPSVIAPRCRATMSGGDRLPRCVVELDQF
eukprot:CAMPEP_0195584430 /NCGR_PEP_ID=MMETSP0814-20130614/25911_1 /TAXON_ID=97485 /ORGANISM="Prymnesium parvum, Strain Texoma1" /LENGTH=191 /DNA_ID=CAMNT_0040722519 /DNA_START=122 /DNA_END=697 /DNA_ORIENTATION=-